MNALTATHARAGLYALIDQVALHHEPVLIAGKRHHAVLVGAEDWSSIQETLWLMSVPGMTESLLEARAQPLSAYSEELVWPGE
jgi:antitoxin YefM